MCARFAFTSPTELMIRLFKPIPANNLPLTPNYNVCPTTNINVIDLGENGRRLRAMRWGFLPYWYKTPKGGPLLINARSETIAEKPAFRAACRARRCLIPATGFYEWSKDADGKSLPWYISSADGGPFTFAGVWQDWDKGDELLTTCAIVTTSANRSLARIHHRMPVTIAPENWPLWLGEEGKGAAILMQPAPEDRFVFHRVGTRVNSNRATGPELIDPLDSID